MRNEKGVTLVELMAAISIFSLVLSVAFLLFSQVNTLWNHSVDEYNYKSDVGLMSDTISSELSQAVELYLLIGSDTELRYKNIKDEYKAFIYSSADKKLSQYKANTTPSDITIDPFPEDQHIVSSENVLAFDVEYYVPPSTRTKIVSSSTLSTTSLYYINITFEDPRITDSGGTHQPKEILIKPFQK